MPTLLVSHHDCLEHETGGYHPENPDRLRSVLQILESEDFFMLHREEAPRATLEQLTRVHPQSYIDDIMSHIPKQGYYAIDSDTPLSPKSGEAALRAAGGVCAAVDAVVARQARNAFVAVRPPGHHATRTQPMGFCIFNNVAIGAMQARSIHGLGRVAVIDWDVHHGNGTQDIFWNDPDAFYASTHQFPLYPGTGSAEETGAHNNIVNCPLPSGSDGTVFMEALDNRIIPALKNFRPHILFISAGFDAHGRDPLANMKLTVKDYAEATRKLMAVADSLCGGRIVSVLEGGYDLIATASSAAAHIRVLMEN
ncbi:histone deacetylase family protein [Haematospirillum sp. H1815]|uniref:histone deacetylase family protein n=1 Tax=Haematospirillum sp. H1815 TaxID=2723108 RepID=UPI00143ABA60|nr:histone deacetylase family protein [Haematospirillum sp. H1815]NKD77712.1 histone deacetylase family protein [Haematospirillum sp. H1815]